MNPWLYLQMPDLWKTVQANTCISIPCKQRKRKLDIFKFALSLNIFSPQINSLTANPATPESLTMLWPSLHLDQASRSHALGPLPTHHASPHPLTSASSHHLPDPPRSSYVRLQNLPYICPPFSYPPYPLFESLQFKDQDSFWVLSSESMKILSTDQAQFPPFLMLWNYRILEKKKKKKNPQSSLLFL